MADNTNSTTRQPMAYKRSLIAAGLAVLAGLGGMAALRFMADQTAPAARPVALQTPVGDTCRIWVEEDRIGDMRHVMDVSFNDRQSRGLSLLDDQAPTQPGGIVLGTVQVDPTELIRPLGLIAQTSNPALSLRQRASDAYAIELDAVYRAGERPDAARLHDLAEGVATMLGCRYAPMTYRT